MPGLEAILSRRAALLARASRDRDAVALAMAPLAGPLRIADKVWNAASWLRRRPLIASLIFAGFGALGPRRPLRWMRLGLSAWQAWRWTAAAMPQGGTKRSRGN